MNFWDFAVGGVLLLAFLLAVRFCVKHRKQGGCGGDCAACPHRCGQAGARQTRKER